MTHVTCKLIAKNRDQLRNPTLGNRVWATFLHEKTNRYTACVKSVYTHEVFWKSFPLAEIFSQNILRLLYVHIYVKYQMFYDYT